MKIPRSPIEPIFSHPSSGICESATAITAVVPSILSQVNVASYFRGKSDPPVHAVSVPLRTGFSARRVALNRTNKWSYLSDNEPDMTRAPVVPTKELASSGFL